MEQTCAHPENADSAHATVFGQGPVLGLPDRAGELWVSLGLKPLGLQPASWHGAEGKGADLDRCGP